MAKGARTEFTAAVHPADDPSVREGFGHPLEQRCLIEVLDRLAVFPRGAAKSMSIDRRAPQWVIGHVAVGIAEVDAVGVQGGAQGAAGIAGRRRHEHPIETRLSQDAGVSDAVDATPPPKQRSDSPVSRRSRVAISTRTSSSRRWTLAAQSARRRPSVESRSIGSYR